MDSGRDADEPVYAGYRPLVLPEEEDAPPVAAPVRQSGHGSAAVAPVEQLGVALTVAEADLVRVSDEYGSFRSRSRRRLADARAEGRAEALTQMAAAVAAAALVAADGQASAAARALASAVLSGAAAAGAVMFGAVGDVFDPQACEAVSHVGGEGQMVVTAVLRPGMRVDGKVVTPALVAVGPAVP